MIIRRRYRTLAMMGMDATANTLQLSTYLGLLAEVTGQPVDRDAGSAVRQSVPQLQLELKDVGNALDERVMRIGRSYGAHLVYQGLPTFAPPKQAVRSWLGRGPNRTITERISHSFQDWLHQPGASTLGRAFRLMASITTQLLHIATASREYAAWSASLAEQLQANQKRILDFTNQPTGDLARYLLQTQSGDKSNLTRIAGRIEAAPTLVDHFIQSMRKGADEALLPLNAALEAVRMSPNAEPGHTEALQHIELKGINTQDVPRLTIDGRKLPDSRLFANGDREVERLISRYRALSLAVTERIRNVQGVQAILDNHAFYGILMEGWSAKSMEYCLGSLGENSGRVRDAVSLTQASPPVRKTG